MLCRERGQKVNRKTWDKYVSNIEYDIHAGQNTTFKIMEYVGKSERDEF
jgi:hypothetical protein